MIELIWENFEISFKTNIDMIKKSIMLEIFSKHVNEFDFQEQSLLRETNFIYDFLKDYKNRENGELCLIGSYKNKVSDEIKINFNIKGKKSHSSLMWIN